MAVKGKDLKLLSRELYGIVEILRQVDPDKATQILLESQKCKDEYCYIQLIRRALNMLNEKEKNRDREKRQKKKSSDEYVVISA